MKRMLSMIALALMSSAPLLYANDKETLFDEEDTWNLYTKLGLSYAEIGADEALWGTVEVGGILNNRLALGLRVTAWGEDVDADFDRNNKVDMFDVVYGGLALEYIGWANKLVHISGGLFVGGGQLRMNRSSDGDDKDIGLFVLEPSLQAMVNETPRSELGVGVGYRYADAGSGVGDDELSGVVGTLFLRLTSN
mgnify:CR=1 FL=1